MDDRDNDKDREIDDDIYVYIGGACRSMIIMEVGSAAWMQIMNEIVCIFTNDLRKGMNQIIFPLLWINSMVDCAL